MQKSYLSFFEYTFITNEKYIWFFENEKIDGEFHLTEMSHVLKAHKLWLQRIEGNVDFNEFWDIIPVAEMKKLNAELKLKTIEIVNNFDLEQIINYSNSKGTKYSNRLEDILFHLVNHANYHRARTATFLREQNIVPPNSDFIAFVR